MAGCPHSLRASATPDGCTLCLDAPARRVPFVELGAALAEVKRAMRRVPRALHARAGGAIRWGHER